MCLTHWGFFVIIPIMNLKLRQINLKLKKFDEIMVKLKTKYLDKPIIYSDLHKLDLKKDEIQKLIDNDNS